MRSLQKHSNTFQRLPITETYLFGPKHTLFGGEGQGGKTNWPKKIYIPRVIFKIPGPPCLPLLDCVELQYSCCYHSLHLDIGILRSVKFFIYSAFFNKLLPLVLSLGSSGSCWKEFSNGPMCSDHVERSWHRIVLFRCSF